MRYRLPGRPQVSSVIIGAKTLEQLEDSLGASGLELPAEDLKTLDAVSALPPLKT